MVQVSSTALMHIEINYGRQSAIFNLTFFAGISLSETSDNYENVVGIGYVPQSDQYYRSLPVTTTVTAGQYPSKHKTFVQHFKTSTKRLRRWSNIVQMLYQYFVFTEMSP